MNDAFIGGKLQAKRLQNSGSVKTRLHLPFLSVMSFNCFMCSVTNMRVRMAIFTGEEDFCARSSDKPICEAVSAKHYFLLTLTRALPLVDLTFSLVG